jgi:hypothetical protein
MFITLVLYSSILTIGFLFLLYRSWAILVKNEELENAVNRSYARVVLTVKLMRMFDEKQVFESDDEVGETFKQLRDCTEELYTYVTELRDETITPEEQ